MGLTRSRLKQIADAVLAAMPEFDATGQRIAVTLGQALRAAS